MRAATRSGFLDGLMRQRPLGALLPWSLAVGLAHALLMFPLGLIAGTSAWWDFPHGIITLSHADIGTSLAGYLYFLHAPWGMPLLHVTALGAPVGSNIAFVDAVPLVALLGKIAFTLTGHAVNLLGLWVLACYSLSAPAMALLLWEAGERRLLPVLAGAVFAAATPYLLFRWGHISLGEHFLPILALALYLRTVQRPDDRGVELCWFALLAACILVHPYFFAMAGPCWAAALAQNRIDGRLSTRAVTALLLATGILAPGNASAGASGYGRWSLDPFSPFVPQLSGIVPWMAERRIGDTYQYEGFVYLGGGVLLLLVASLRTGIALICARWRAHAVMLIVLTGFVLFAISNVIDVGFASLTIPVPWRILYYLGAFRASGRFFWPVGYALMALAVFATARAWKPGAAASLLVVAISLQLVDVAPLRARVWASSLAPTLPQLDRRDLAARVAQASAVIVYPSYACAGGIPQEVLGMEIILAAARADKPINSIYNPRLVADCAAEEARMREPLRPGTLYVYTRGYVPNSAQLGGADPAQACQSDGTVRHCLLP